MKMQANMHKTLFEQRLHMRMHILSYYFTGMAEIYSNTKQSAILRVRRSDFPDDALYGNYLRSILSPGASIVVVVAHAITDCDVGDVMVYQGAAEGLVRLSSFTLLVLYVVFE